MWITQSSQEATGSPGRPVRHRQDTHQNKTAVNKGVWEFRELRHAREAAASVQAEAARTSRELVEF